MKPQPAVSAVTPGTTFIVSQAFPIPFCSERIIDNDIVRAFFESANDFRGKKGCYVFALKVAKGYTPYYIGKTTRNFEQEIFQPHKLSKYAGVMSTKKGSPVIFFITPENICGACPKTAIDEVETYLIRKGRKRNPDLCNQKKTTPVRWNIKGVKNSRPGKPSKEEGLFKKMMGI